MIQSTTYLDSVENGELVPQITLSPLANPDDEWSTLELGEILYKQTISYSIFHKLICYSKHTQR